MFQLVVINAFCSQVDEGILKIQVACCYKCPQSAKQFTSSNKVFGCFTISWLGKP